MEEILRISLPIYFIFYFGIVFLLKSFIVGKRIGKSPFVLPNNDSIYGLIGRYFKIIFTSLFVYIALFSIFPNLYQNFLPVEFLETEFIKFMGIGFLIVSLIWTIIAQNQMKNSWRMGIDTNTKTELIKKGLFKFSRNPIFLGLIFSLVGLFLVTPNTITVIILILGYVLIQVQIRLEEAFLIDQHTTDYTAYQQKVRRFI
ncbi:MAG: methyltransferase family protein [Polaribacter sp.]